MNEYFDGVIPQYRSRVRNLLRKIPSVLPCEIHPLKQVCEQKLNLVDAGFKKLVLDSPILAPEMQQKRIQEYQELIRELNLLEMVAIPVLARLKKSDLFLNRLVQQIRSEIRYPLPAPIVSPFSQKYVELYPSLHLICVPLNEANHLLHLADIYHELGHPVISSDLHPFPSKYCQAMEQSRQMIRRWWNQELDRENRGRGPGDFKFYINRFSKSWEKWVIEFFCDLFATYTLGPAFGWSHLHLCTTRAGKLFQIPIDVSPSHPADDARMRTVLIGLRLIGFEAEADRILHQWQVFTHHLQEEPEPEYQRCYPLDLLEKMAREGLAGVQEIGCRVANRNTNDPVHVTLNHAWEVFWESPSQFAQNEQNLMKSLKKALEL